MKIKRSVLGLTLFSSILLAGCTNYAQKNVKDSESSSYSLALKNAKATPTQTANAKTLKAVDSDNPYTKVTKTKGRVYQDGLEVPPKDALATLALQDKRNTLVADSQKVLAKSLTSKQLKDDDTVREYLHYISSQKPYSYKEIYGLVEDKVSQAVADKYVVKTTSVYDNMAQYRIIYDYGLNHLPSAKDATTHLKDAGFSSSNIKFAVSMLGLN